MREQDAAVGVAQRPQPRVRSVPGAGVAIAWPRNVMSTRSTHGAKRQP